MAVHEKRRTFVHLPARFGRDPHHRGPAVSRLIATKTSILPMVQTRAFVLMSSVILLLGIASVGVGASLFSPQVFSRLYGIAFGLILVGTGTGPILLSYLHDRFGTYSEGLLLFVAIGLVCTAITLAMPR